MNKNEKSKKKSEKIGSEILNTNKKKQQQADCRHHCAPKHGPFTAEKISFN